MDITEPRRVHEVGVADWIADHSCGVVRSASLARWGIRRIPLRRWWSWLLALYWRRAIVVVTCSWTAVLESFGSLLSQLGMLTGYVFPQPVLSGLVAMSEGTVVADVIEDSLGYLWGLKEEMGDFVGIDLQVSTRRWSSSIS